MANSVIVRHFEPPRWNVPTTRDVGRDRIGDRNFDPSATSA